MKNGKTSKEMDVSVIIIWSLNVYVAKEEMYQQSSFNDAYTTTEIIHI
jgi:hypothetical protein